MRLDVASSAGIVVVSPSAAEISRLLENDEIVEPRLLKADRHPEPRETCSDDDDRRLLHAAPRCEDKGGLSVSKPRSAQRYCEFVAT